MEVVANVWEYFRSFSLARSESDCQTAQECLKRILACINSIERSTVGNSLQFNHSLCERFVSKYIRRARELLEERHSEIDVYSEQCAPALTALHKTLNDAQFLIQKHCTSSKVWLWAAVELVENTSVFAEVILDLTWYIYALQIAIEVSRGTPTRQLKQQKDLIWELQKLAMTEHEDFHERWESECQQLSLREDREALLGRLKTEVRNGAELRSLDSYLARKLGVHHMHAREALAVNLNIPELLRERRLLGEGSYGRVFKVQWLGMPCALKQVVTADADEVVPEEVKILSKIFHPNIIQLYGYFYERGTLYLIMELMDETLSDYVTSKEWSHLQSSPDFLLVALDIMLQIAKGVRYLHSKGMVHRDLKGENVLVKPSENPERKSRGFLSVKLTDFGLAKANLRQTTYSSLVNVGSLPWKAPELFRIRHNKPHTPGRCPKRKHYPFKPDVYSFGIVCAEILCAKKPFSSAELMPTWSFYARVKGGELRPKLPEDILPPGLAEYIKRCWDTDPINRPDFVDICKRIRHFRDSLLNVTAFIGWELTSSERKAVLEETSAIDEIHFVDIPEEDWDWSIPYEEIDRQDKIHSGSGFLSVYIAQLKTKSQRVLAKYIEVTLIDNDASIASFKEEVGLLARIRHPNLVHYLGATRRAPFVVVTEFARGVTLRKFFETRTPEQQDELRAVHIALQIARGLAALHDEGALSMHGELTPDCILIDDTTMIAKVADFGLRKFRKEASRATPRWYRQAPEQHSGVEHSSVDVFSFGMILWELLQYEEAKLFWKKSNHASRKLQEGKRPDLGLSEHYPKGVHALIKRCWLHNWQERPSFASIVADLQKIHSDLQKKQALSTRTIAGLHPRAEHTSTRTTR
jgi:serine/threonine protein kinase